MDNEQNADLCQSINQDEIIKIVKDNYGIDFLINDLLPAELEKQGYRKMSLDELHYVKPLFQLAPQLIKDKIYKGAVEQGFKAATENSYKCLLDTSKMHLATIKGKTDVFIGSGLNNATNKVEGQARWIKNEAVLSISNASQFALTAFNTLSTVTGHYFMAQINANLLDMKGGIDGIKQYIDDVKQSELKAALLELNDIIEHIRFIKNDPERVYTTKIQIDDIRNVARTNIIFYKNQIEKIMRDGKSADKETVIKKNTKELKNNIVQYRYAVYVYNLAQIQKIYLNDITDVEELSIFRNKICNIVNQYKKTIDDATVWGGKYIDEANTLNEASKRQILITLGSGILGDVIGRKTGNYELARETKSLVNKVFINSRKKKKDAYILSNDEFHIQMNNTELIDSAITAMDRYIDMMGKRAEIVSIEGDCYIKYI